MIHILDKNEKLLRKHAKPISKKEIGSKDLSKILDRMSKALGEQDDGVAIAAPQVGESIRVFVVSKKIFPTEGIDKVFINPEIIKKSRDRKAMIEGCLSVRWLYGKVKRASRAVVKATDEHGQEFEMEGRGLLAQIFQHEIDHLDGILFIDTAKELEEIPPHDHSKPKK